MRENYTKNWVNLLREERGLEATEAERRHLNTTIATIATKGCTQVYQSKISHKMAKAAREIIRSARQDEREPLEFLIKVCDEVEGLDVNPESFLIATKYTEV